MINKAGIKYRDEVSGRYKKFRKKYKELNLPEKLSNNQIYERCMRMGPECQLYQLDNVEVWDVAHATLKDDILRKYLIEDKKSI